MSPESLPDLLSAGLALVMERLAEREGLLVLGIAGSQGSGKSTLARALADRLNGEGLSCAAVSIDDFYLSPQERERLADAIHPLLRTRGVPGTHDVNAAIHVIDDLRVRRGAVLPRFDKANDAPFPPSRWTAIGPDLRVLIIEGWCLGARPQPDAMLREPVNRLEAKEDPDGRWRSFVNDQLAGSYRELFSRIDALIFLAAPGFNVVEGWRRQQEADIAGQGHAVMDAAAITRFIQFYQRITQWMLLDLPAHADLVIRLDEERRVIAIDG